MFEGYLNWYNLSGKICEHFEQSIPFLAIHPTK